MGRGSTPPVALTISDTAHGLLDLLIFLIKTYSLRVRLISKGHWLIRAPELSLIHRHFHCSRCLNSKECVCGWDLKPK